MRRSSTPEQERRSGGTCFLLAASDYTCPADGGVRKTGTAPPPLDQDLYACASALVIMDVSIFMAFVWF